VGDRSAGTGRLEPGDRTSAHQEQSRRFGVAILGKELGDHRHWEEAMRLAAGCGASAVVLAIAGVVDVAGTWSVAAAAVLFLIGGVVAAIALEARDLESVGGGTARLRTTGR
jgi:hypothetical protein